MKLQSIFFASMLLVCLHFVAGGHDLSQEYQFSTVLDSDGSYALHWSFDLQRKTIAFAVNVSTTGWVGFGLSPTGNMPGSDVIIGWVDRNGQVMFHDRFADGYFLPSIDESQDWFLVRGEEEDGQTILEFTRNLTSCDERDLDIQADTSRIVWSYHSRDPTSLNAIPEHSKMGSLSLNLLGGLAKKRVEENSESFFIRNENLTIPSADTTYWCSVHRFPEQLREQQRYMYKFGPAITQHSSRYVHHIVIYLCDALNHTNVGDSTVCEDAHINIGICRGTGVPIAVWAVGGNEFVLPDNVALPIGGTGNAEYVVLEMHYDNPNEDIGVVDSSGIEFFYTNTPPVHNAGMFTVAYAATSVQVIPPGADNFITKALCPSKCSEKFLPPEGITVFANILHTHLAGHGLVLRHFRENEECGALEELPPIDENRRYDFNYQQINHLPREVKILPGDTLQLECFYRTSNYDGVTLGGESTRNEMCVSFLYYYPQADLSVCYSQPQLPDAFNDLTQQNLNDTQVAELYQHIQNFNEEGVKTILNQIDWSQDTVDMFQQSLLTNDLSNICFDRKTFISAQEPLPNVDCTYERPDSCTGTQPVGCCQRHQTTTLFEDGGFSGAPKTAALYHSVHILSALAMCVLNMIFLIA